MAAEFAAGVFLVGPQRPVVGERPIAQFCTRGPEAAVFGAVIPFRGERAFDARRSVARKLWNDAPPRPLILTAAS